MKPDNWIVKTSLFGICFIGLIISYMTIQNKFSIIREKETNNNQNRILRVVHDDEKHFKFHRCRDGGEVYGAAYIIKKEFLLKQFTDYALKNVNCEMASFVMFSKSLLIQAVDVIDFSMVHLSAYERLQRRYASKKRNKIFMTGNIALISSIVEPLQLKAQQIRGLRNYTWCYTHVCGSNNTTANSSLSTSLSSSSSSSSSSYLSKLNHTLVIMPFLGNAMGAGHSNLENRYVYLRACFWSLFKDFPNIVAVVSSDIDLNFAVNISGLPFYDVILASGLPKSASLPVATVQQVKARVADGRYEFDYIFFTESDQLLVMRIPQEIFAYLENFPFRLVVPHRLMPYPQTIANYYNKTVYGNSDSDIHRWKDFSCCLPRQNCDDKRKSWVHVNYSSIALLSVHGLAVPLGNTNFHIESYRGCKMMNYTHICPY